MTFLQSRLRFVLLAALLACAAGLTLPSRGVAQAPAAAPSAAVATAPEAGTVVEQASPSGLRPLPTELSPWSMFMNADLVVKVVMVGLAFASFLTWTIFLGKSAEILLAGRRLRAGMSRVSGSATLNEAYLSIGRSRRRVVAALVREAVQEVRMSEDIRDEAGLRDRVASRFAETLKAEGQSVRRGMGLLATIGSTAPFVGLFGTVWGIMNSFIGISKAQTTNLAVVAPGIAEALLATAIGLVAAIPAVIIYNHFTRQTRSYLDEAGRAAGVVNRLLSRDLDRTRGGLALKAAE